MSNVCFPDVIIAGVGRCGTTSLYRYLGASSEVKLSAKKELDFLVDYTDADISFLEEKYLAAFQGAKTSQVKVEASPRYSLEAEYTAAMIKRLMPETKVVLMLRDPVERIVSVYNAVKRSGNIRQSVSFDDFVMFLFGEIDVISENSMLNDRYKKALANGCYFKIIDEYQQQIGKNNVYVMFLENLDANPSRELRLLSDFLKIDGSCFDQASYEVENPAINVRNPVLYKLALELNSKLEPVLNKFPNVRSSLRKIHSKVNQVEKREVEGEHARYCLSKYYQPFNLELRSYLTNNAVNDLPDWLLNCDR